MGEHRGHDDRGLQERPLAQHGWVKNDDGDVPGRSQIALRAFRGPRGRVWADHVATDWTPEAEADDRRYRRLAIGVGLVGALLALGTWFAIIATLPATAAALVDEFTGRTESGAESLFVRRLAAHGFQVLTQVPLAGSQITSLGVGAVSSTISLMIWRGVRN